MLGRTMAMALGNRVMVSPSLLCSNSGGAAVTQVRNLRNGMHLPLQRSGLRRHNKSAPEAVNPTPLRMGSSRRTELVCSAMQAETDVLVEESEPEQALENLKRLADLEGGNSKAADDGELLRFLRAQSFDAEKAARAFARHQKWRKEFVPRDYFLESDLPAELEAKKAYWLSQDKKGRPALLCTGRNHIYNKDFDEFKRFLVYVFDRILREVPPNAEQFICIVDLKGLGLKNLDSKSFITAFEILQNHYPQRVDKVFMINVPLIFNGIWKVVKPFIDEDTRNRIVFVDKKKTTETLANEMDIEFLPKEYGGTADLVLLQDAVTANWPPSS